jgi:hypothetical protein
MRAHPHTHTHTHTHTLTHTHTRTHTHTQVGAAETATSSQRSVRMLNTRLKKEITRKHFEKPVRDVKINADRVRRACGQAGGPEVVCAVGDCFGSCG